MKHATLVLLALAMVGCGGGGGGGGGGAAAPAVPAPIPPFIQAVNIHPDSATLDIDDTLALTVTVSWSDGTLEAVSGAWSCASPAGTLDAATGSSVLLTAVDEGTVQVTVLHQGVQGAATFLVVDAIPADPGPFYASSDAGEIMRYETPGAPPTLVATAGGNGIVMNSDATALFVIGGETLSRVELDGTYATSFVATLPADPNIRVGLAVDGIGRIYNHGYGDGLVHRIDPAAGAVAEFGTIPVQQIGNCIGPDDAFYTTGIMGGGIYRIGPGGGAATTWSTVSTTVTSGLAINRRGEAFTGDLLGPSILRCVDLNGDGDATDAGEETVFATIAGDSNYGLGIAGGGSLLVNNQPWGFAGGTPGMYWLRDLNGDGDADDLDEQTIYSPDTVYNGFDGGCIAAPR